MCERAHTARSHHTAVGRFQHARGNESDVSEHAHMSGMSPRLLMCVTCNRPGMRAMYVCVCNANGYIAHLHGQGEPRLGPPPFPLHTREYHGPATGHGQMGMALATLLS